jgi:hypothetical protein
MSNLLAMPLVRLTIETGNNEDWIDSIKFVVDTGEPVLPQLDIRDIVFEMEVRREAGDHEVVLAASTENNTLKIGAAPNFGFLTISIPIADMDKLRAGEYVGDIIGRDEINTRVIAQITLTIIEGATKQPVNLAVIAA